MLSLKFSFSIILPADSISKKSESVKIVADIYFILFNIALGRIINKVCPPTHHLPSLWQPLGGVVGRARLVILGMGELKLYPIAAEAVLVQDGAKGAPKAMDRGLTFVP